MTTLSASHNSTNDTSPLFDFFAPSSSFFTDRFFEFVVEGKQSSEDDWTECLKGLDHEMGCDKVWRSQNWWLSRYFVVFWCVLKTKCNDDNFINGERRRETELYVVKKGCVACPWVETTQKKPQSISRWD